MASLRRLLKRQFLDRYLDAACRSYSRAIDVAVWSAGERLAGADAACPGVDGALTLPICANGTAAGELVVRASPGPAGTASPPSADEIRERAAFLAASLQTIVDAEVARRAVGAETLDLYRELSHLHRATIALTASLRQVDVADALIAEIGHGAFPADVSAVFWGDPGSAGLAPLRVDRSAEHSDLAALSASRLFHEIAAAGQGEIVNDLAIDARWAGEVPELRSILIEPFMSEGQARGALVLAIVDGAQEFTAADLKRASTLASMAGAALRNAQLFEEVLEIKNHSETILENLSNGVVTLDHAGQVTRANAAALAMLGRPGAELAGEPAEAVWRDDNAWVLESLAAVVGGEPQRIVLDQAIRGDDGKTTSVNLSVRPLANLAHETIGTILVLEDVTREKRMKGTMVRFMSDRVVDQLLAEGESLLGGSAQQATILFSDIRGFTSLSERLSPRELVTTLNEYFTGMVDVIFARGGTLDKFIGDALMAVFGAPFVSPDDPDRAVEAAIEMVRRLHGFNRDWVKEGRPSLGIGVGVNTGEVVAGTIGSPKRMDYTVIGDHVNLAARIESANRYYGTRVLVSEHTVEKLTGRHQMRELDRVRVQGRNLPVRLFEILDHHTRTTFPHMAEALAAFEEGLRNYRHREWELGAQCFGKGLRANPKDRPTQIFLDRCWTYIAQPPDDSWTDITDLGSLGK